MSLQIKVAKVQGGAPASVLMGDPGLFGWIGDRIRDVGGAILSATPIGRAVTAGVGILTGTRGTVTTRPASVPFVPTTTRPPITVRRGPGIPNLQAVNGGTPRGADIQTATGARQRFFPTGATGLGAGCQSGFHPNKSSYRLLSGELVEKGTRCVRNRRRNPMNPRALDRAIGRIVSAKKMSKKLGTISVRKTCPK